MAVQTREKELQAMKARDLMRLATTLGVKGSWDMKKAEVIEAILRAESAKDSEQANMAAPVAENGDPSAKVNVKVDDCGNDVEVAGKVENVAASVDMTQKMPYIESAEVGTIVAFRLTNGKVKSAKIIKKSTKNRRFMLETSYGAQYIIPYKDIIWVRTGKRWPRGVYRLLKGLVENEAKAN